MARRQKTVYDYLTLFTLPGVRNVDWQQYDIRLRKVEPGSYLDQVFDYVAQQLENAFDEGVLV